MAKKLVMFVLLFIIPFSICANKNHYHDKSLEKVSIQLQFFDQFQFAGYYMAKEKGFYEDVGLDVEIKKYTPDIVSIDEVMKGNADFAVGRSSGFIERANGKKFVALAAIFQSSPLVLLTSADKKWTQLSDIRGKKGMITSDIFHAVSMQAMLNAEGIDNDSFQKVPHDYNLSKLIEGEVDFISAYISNEPYILRKKGFIPVIFNPLDYGFDFYEDILFTDERTLKNHPKRVKKFREATLKGWEYAFTHMEESVNVILEKFNIQNKTHDALLYEARELKKLAYYGSVNIGDIDIDKVKKIYQTFQELGLTKKSLDFESVIYNETTYDVVLDSEEKKYLQEKKSISMCVDPSWMPYESIKDGKHIGMAADIMRLLAKKIDIPFELVPTENWNQSVEYAKSRKCDIYSLAMETPSRRDYMDFTNPYLEFPFVVATTLDEAFVNDTQQIEGKSVAVMRNYAIVEILRNKYKNISIVEVDSVLEALKLVKRKKVFGYIDSLATMKDAIDRHHYHDSIKISGKLDEMIMLSIGVRNDDTMLFKVLSKGLNSIDPMEKELIVNRWLAVVHEHVVDYDLVWKLLGLFFIVLFAILWAYNKLQNAKNRLQESLNNFEILLDSTRDIVVVIDRDMRILLVNRAGLDTFGYKKEELSNLSVKDFIEPENEEVIRLIQKFDTNIAFELELYAKDRTRIPCLASGKNIVYNGKPAWVSILTNLSQEKLAQQKLIDINASLEEKVRDEVQNSRQKDKQILAQSRLAQMGEMISMIAHQWRQPLSAIAASGMDMKLAMMIEKFDLKEESGREKFHEYLNQHLVDIEKYVANLTETIDDFRNFYKPNKEREISTINMPLEKSIDILKGALNANGIKVIVDLKSTNKVALFKNELMQVFINVLKNAMDNFVEKETKNPLIVVESHDINHGAILRIHDNGGGIPHSIIENIFDPYFSTKSEKNGTGLGLYMSKIIVEEHHRGQMYAKNFEDGACFIVEIYEHHHDVLS